MLNILKNIFKKSENYLMTALDIEIFEKVQIIYLKYILRPGKLKNFVLQ